MEPRIFIQGPGYGVGRECEAILRSLPQWFGIEQAIVQYGIEIETLPTFLAYLGDTLAGFLTVKQHFPESAEILVMGVRPEAHRQGLGGRLVERAQDWLRSERVEFLQVKTLAPASPDPSYARTRLFYEAMGFQPLEVFPLLWDEWNPCLLMIKRL